MTARLSGGRRLLRTAVVLALLAAVAWFVAARLGTQWSEFRRAAITLHPRWDRLALASALVLATYALLIQSWRVILQGWGGKLGFRDAARIFFVSGLARFLPGALWAVGAMGVLAERAGVAPAAAAGAAILGQVLNIAAGFVVLTAAGGEALPQFMHGVSHPRLVTAVLGLAGVVVLPVVLPALTALAARLLRREQPPRLPLRTLVAAFGANLLSWVGYGVAFGWLARALLPGTIGAAGSWSGYVAVYSGAYLAGLLALLAPGGLVVREGAIVFGLTRAGMASPVDAALLAVASRLWLTVLEVAPGVGFLVAGAIRRGHAVPVSPNGSGGGGSGSGSPDRTR